MRHSAGAWSGKTSEVPPIPFQAQILGRRFQNPPSGKLHPVLDADSGARFPLRASRGNLIPFLAPIPGCAFRRVHGSLLYSARYASSAGKVASASWRPTW